MKFPYRKIIFLICLLSAYQAFAAAPNVTLFMANWVKYNVNAAPQELPAITVTDVAGGGITQAAGISIILPQYMEVLWDKSVTEIKVNDIAITPSYSKDLKIITIPVSKTFTAGESAKITGHKIRIYDSGATYQDLRLDVTGDGVSDATGINGIELSETTKETDVLGPYAVTAFTTALNGTSSVTLAWENPPDLDFNGTMITRTINRLGTSTVAQITLDRLKAAYSDTDILPGDEIQYSVKSKDDVGNLSGAVSTSVKIPLETLQEPVATPEMPENVTPEITPQPTTIFDTVTETQINEALLLYEDINPETANLKIITYLVNKGVLKGKKKKLALDKRMTYLEFINASGKAFDVQKQGSYWKTFQGLGYLKKTAKKKNVITKKNAVAILLNIKGLMPKEQNIIEYASLKGKSVRADFVSWFSLLATATQG